MPKALADQLARDGYCVIEGLVEATECERLAVCLETAVRGGVGSRRLLVVSAIADLARELAENGRIRHLLPAEPTGVQATAFVKDADRRWGVGLHRDLQVPFAERVEHPDCRTWSRKEGREYCRPPDRLLDGLLAVRLQLDPGDADAGPLEIVPGSHLDGEDEREASFAEAVPAVIPRGGALLMRPRLLHGSRRPAVGTAKRRVLHLLYGPRRLPLGLAWAQA